MSRKKKQKNKKSKPLSVKDIKEVAPEVLSEKLVYYLGFLGLSYEDSLLLLRNKYGEGYDDYYREKSYQRFLNGEIKSITKGKYSRAKEGLYCHHIDEDKFLNMSNLDFIKIGKISYEFQRKDRLVYCDLIEHTILHAQIALKTDGLYGLSGYKVFLYPMIEDWMIRKRTPKPDWMRKCKDRALLTLP